MTETSGPSPHEQRPEPATKAAGKRQPPWYSVPSRATFEQTVANVLDRHKDQLESAVDWAERIVDRTINKGVGILTFDAFLLVIAVLIITDGWSWAGVFPPCRLVCRAGRASFYFGF
jgi:hypothetical protein